MPRALLLLPALLSLAACAPRASLPDTDRERIVRDLQGRQQYLRVAAFSAPLWADRERMLLTAQPVSELDLVNTTGGTPVTPPPAERVLLPGTPVRVGKIEFPTGWLIAKRVVMSPRYHPWVYVEVPGERRPHVVVLSQSAASFEDVRDELEGLLSSDDPGPALRSLPQEQQAAIARKTLVEGMSARALEMAWGLPERKHVDRPAGTEEWTWPGAKRRAYLRDERLVRWETPRP